MPRPEPSEYAHFYGKYVALTPEDDSVAALRSELAATLELLKDVPDDEAMKLHPPYTWTIKGVVGHITDAERIFAYRALRIARADATPLSGFDENAYMIAARFDDRTLPSLLEEYDAVRRSSISLFASLQADDWTRLGTANGHEISVRALAAVIVGHQRHHTSILRKRLGRA